MKDLRVWGMVMLAGLLVAMLRSGQGDSDSGYIAAVSIVYTGLCLGAVVIGVGQRIVKASSQPSLSAQDLQAVGNDIVYAIKGKRMDYRDRDAILEAIGNLAKAEVEVAHQTTKPQGES